MPGKRFYLSSYRYAPDREPVIEDLGNHLTVAGMVFQGMGSTLILFNPGIEIPADMDDITVAQPSIEEWGEIIRRTDNAEMFVGEEGGIRKVLHRKLRYALSGDVQQKVWARDNFSCVFCGARMGEQLLTVDHFVPLEMGGVNDDSNYVTACRPCNKAKGMLMPDEFCRIKRFPYSVIAENLRRKSGGLT